MINCSVIRDVRLIGSNSSCVRIGNCIIEYYPIFAFLQFLISDITFVHIINSIKTTSMNEQIDYMGANVVYENCRKPNEEIVGMPW